jgi:uncharacterized sporulation protein YeaH/YhbH (DUF444 family)
LAAKYILLSSGGDEANREQRKTTMTSYTIYCILNGREDVLIEDGGQPVAYRTKREAQAEARMMRLRMEGSGVPVRYEVVRSDR